MQFDFDAVGIRTSQRKIPGFNQGMRGVTPDNQGAVEEHNHHMQKSSARLGTEARRRSVPPPAAV